MIFSRALIYLNGQKECGLLFGRAGVWHGTAMDLDDRGMDICLLWAICRIIVFFMWNWRVTHLCSYMGCEMMRRLWLSRVSFLPSSFSGGRIEKFSGTICKIGC
ncbi:hypothetical protein Dimus_003121 [Dionaea muscipula]